MRHLMTSRGRREERGAAAVEFALVAMLLVTLLFGIMQVSLWFWAWQAGGTAAREAARAAAVTPCNEGSIKAAGKKPLSNAPIDGDADVSREPIPDLKVGKDVTVTVTFKAIDLHFVPFDWFNPNITKSETARIENLPAVVTGC